MSTMDTIKSQSASPRAEDHGTPAPPLLHIGYMKTGSTWLQKHLLWDASRGFLEACDRDDLHNLLLEQPPLSYHPDQLRNACRDRLHVAAAEGLVPVISHETLIGNPMNRSVLAVMQAQRMREVFPEGRVLIFIREQKSMLLSTHNEYVNAGGGTGLARWLSPPSDAAVPLFHPVSLEYDRTIHLYQDLFGSNRVLVLAFEQLRRDTQGVLDRITAFCERDPVAAPLSRSERASRPPLATAAQRVCNRWCYRSTLNPAPSIHSRRCRRLAEEAGGLLPSWLQERCRAKKFDVIRRWSAGRYRESNQRVESMTGLPLGEFGYER